MAGLNNLISNTAQQTTTLPSWFDTAQQNVVSQAGAVLGAAPTPQQTVGQQAVNTLSGQTNAFSQAGNTLQQIASGAANPWIVTPTYAQPSAQTQPSFAQSPYGMPNMPNMSTMGTRMTMDMPYNGPRGVLDLPVSPQQGMGGMGGQQQDMGVFDSLKSAKDPSLDDLRSQLGTASMNPYQNQNMGGMGDTGMNRAMPSGVTTTAAQRASLGMPPLSSNLNKSFGGTGDIGGMVDMGGIGAQPSGGGMQPMEMSSQGQPTGYTVAPNPNTALGGLFAAQNQQLQQLMPNVTAQPGAASIGAGQFGSLRGQTATNKAMGDAQAQLVAQQMQAALQNQQTGVNAAQGVGNVKQQEIKNLLDVGGYQQASPFTNISNYGKILGGVQAPTTVTNQTQLSPLNQYAGLLSLLGGASGSGGVLGQLGVPGGLQGLMRNIGSQLGFGTSAGSGLSSNLTAGTYPLADGGSMVISADGTRTITSSSGDVSAYDPLGNPLGGSTNAGDVESGGLTEQDLYGVESGYNTYTPDQLDDYQNSYDQG